MNLGRVLFFTSDQAVGHEQRPKYHLFIQRTDDHRATAEYAFLFISSRSYGNCYLINKSDYDFLEHDSFISCGGAVFYSREYLSASKLRFVGEIAKTHLIELRNHLVDHDFMPAWQIKMVCNALPAA
ncbi:hypothetical protein [Bosea sp. RAC05]|uniref:hypothetical protein n=1 Tax=Bosea sp. RAC05 TaxID=1842539 RepID=UPI0012371413|nr:hypothetical protein [Bosea sp. RAC05]